MKQREEFTWRAILDGGGRYWDLADESTHVIRDGKRYAADKAGSGELLGPIERDDSGRWYALAAD